MSDEAAGEPAEEAPPAGRVEAGPEPAGDRRVDEVLARLGELDGAPVSAHVEIFEEIHQRLQELLASADQDDAPPVPGSPVPGSPVPGSPVPGSPVPGSQVPGPPVPGPPRPGGGREWQ